MCNLYTMKLSRDEVRGLLEHYKLVGKDWSDLFARDQDGMNESGFTGSANMLSDDRARRALASGRFSVTVGRSMVRL